MEATIVCIDNSEWTRSGDYAPTRFQAQADAVNLLAGAKTQANPENTVGVLIMAGKTPRVLVTPTPDLGKVLNCMTDINIDGEANISTSVQIAQLALKHRQNKNQRQRIVIFAGSPVREDKDMLVKIAKKLKKKTAVNSNDNSHLVSVPPGPVLSDVLIGSPIFQGEGGGAFGAGAGGGGGGGGGGGFEFGVDPSLDPELALALRVSLEEERARQAASQPAGGGEAAATAGADEGAAAGAPAAAAAAAAGGAGAGAGDMELDEDALLQQALAMSMQVDEPAAAAGPTPAAPSKPAAPSRDAAMPDGDLDDDLQKALALSMQEVVEPAAAAPDASAAIAGLPGVDPNDPSVQAALRNVQGDKEDGKKEGERK
ncbi:26S proteasome non-ATPase regulatory subunit 4 [Scenedesmus sp. NREL 46B-D3]|nr:26S proteasome non-ATPase regulatory subunit 4 [Scenedesmus sp. NREL 46B-D3]